jgi:hypothetical protein
LEELGKYLEAIKKDEELCSIQNEAIWSLSQGFDKSYY